MLSSLFVIVGSGIIGGTPAYHYPFFVIVGMFDETCGGTLVAPDAIVTAAHCLFYEDENRWARPKEVYVIKSYFTEWHWQAGYAGIRSAFLTKHQNLGCINIKKVKNYKINTKLLIEKHVNLKRRITDLKELAQQNVGSNNRSKFQKF